MSADLYINRQSAEQLSNIFDSLHLFLLITHHAQGARTAFECQQRNASFPQHLLSQRVDA